MSPWEKHIYDEQLRVYIEYIGNYYFFVRAEPREWFYITQPEDLDVIPDKRYWLFQYDPNTDDVTLLYSSPPLSVEEMKKIYKQYGGRSHI